MILPDVRELGGREQSDVCARPGFAEALQSGRGHDGIAQPIDTPHENALGRRGRHKLFPLGKLVFAAIARHERGYSFGGHGRWSFSADFPSIVDPEPVGGVAPDGFLESAVDIAHDGFN